MASTSKDLEQRVKEAYSGKTDIGELANFPGALINFGFWDELQNIPITLEQRILSSRSLYKYVLDTLTISSTDTILEVGCGRGTGAVMALQQYQPQKLIAIDITEGQIEKAIALNNDSIVQASERLVFSVASALKTGLAAQSVDKAYSVEAAQHFSSMRLFLEEMYRVLKPGGIISFVCHCAANAEAIQHMHDANLMVAEGIDNFSACDDILLEMDRCGFTSIRQENLSEKVFPGYDKWLRQLDQDSKLTTPWSHNIYEAYNRGWLQYYSFFAKKPQGVCLKSPEHDNVVRNRLAKRNN